MLTFNIETNKEGANYDSDFKHYLPGSSEPKNLSTVKEWTSKEEMESVYQEKEEEEKKNKKEEEKKLENQPKQFLARKMKDN